MNKNIIIKSLLNGVISFFLVAVVLDLVKGISFGQALVEPYNILLGIGAIIGSYSLRFVIVLYHTRSKLATSIW